MKQLQDKILRPNSTIGIVGGGQLGKMSCFAASAMGYKTVVFSDVVNCPASFVTNQTIIGNYQDQAKITEFASLVDIATFEFENIPLAAIEFLSTKKPVYPRPDVLKITQNRVLEKEFLNQIGIKTADFATIKSITDLKNKLSEFNLAVLKTATMGYDGKGQAVLEKNITTAELEKIWDEFKNQQLILEKFCQFEQEISVIIARSLSGEIAVYEPLTNIHKSGILDQSIYPANVSSKCHKQAQEIATLIATKLDLIGVLAIEFFVLPNEELLVNELAPRPHNSGHFSIDGANHSQFEQLIRAIANWKLGSTDFHSKGYMKNLIGDEVKDLEKYLTNSNAKIHLYGKEKIAVGRKMGHVNILIEKK